MRQDGAQAQRAPVLLCYIGAMHCAAYFFFGSFWFSSAPGGREI